MGRSKRVTLDGGAEAYLRTAGTAFLVTVLTLGIAYPDALVLRQRRRAKHTGIDGRQLAFLGTGIGRFGHWIKWFLLSVVTVGVYLFWVVPTSTGGWWRTPIARCGRVPSARNISRFLLNYRGRLQEGKGDRHPLRQLRHRGLEREFPSDDR